MRGSETEAIEKEVSLRGKAPCLWVFHGTRPRGCPEPCPFKSMLMQRAGLITAFGPWNFYLERTSASTSDPRSAEAVALPSADCR
jgi:hypothetical protein